MKFTGECVIGMEKLVLVKKNVYKWAECGFARVEKTVYGVETYGLTGKKELLA